MNYPTNFKNNATSVPLENEHIDSLVQDGLRIIEQEDLDHTTVSGGNTFVYVTKVHEEDGGGIHVVVAKNYEEQYIENVVLGHEPSTDKNEVFQKGYCVIFSVDGKRVIKSDDRATDYDYLFIGNVYQLEFLRPYPIRVEEIFVSQKTKTVFVAFTESFEEVEKKR